MPRVARRKSETGIYHIILRGINRQAIFNDKEDKERFLETIIKYKNICNYIIYAYCFMDNHIHLLLKIGEEPLEQIMRQIGGSYVYWYNHKYNRIGNLFQDRFKSEPVETDAYFITVLRYVHQNPLKAGITKDIKKYQWSSYKEYFKATKIIDKDQAIKIFNEDYELGLEEFTKYHEEINDDTCLEITEKEKKISDEELRGIIEKEYKLRASILQDGFKDNMKTVLKEILKIEGVSTRQVARVTEIPVNSIWKLSRKQ